MSNSNEKSNLPIEVCGLDARYECPVCLSCLKDPVLTKCGHRFCNGCIVPWLKNKGGCCPVDNIQLNQSTDLFPDHCTRREILNEKTICRTCGMEVSLLELEDHQINHSVPEKEEKQNCPFRDVGCLMNVSPDKMAEHFELDIHHHMCLIQKSYLKLQESLKASDPRKMTDALSQEAAFWEPEEKSKNGNPQQTSLLKALYERVVVLEQRAHEQNAQIHKLKGELSISESRIQDLSLLHCSGQYLWHIQQFSEKLSTMRTDRQRMFYSLGFYTSPVGYKLCGRINVSSFSEDQLALFVHLMKSPHDAALDWPFNGRIHLAVVHPNDPLLTVKETMMSRPDLDSFKRTNREINSRAFGYPQFISISDIVNKGFLTGDTLLVKLQIQCV